MEHVWVLEKQYVGMTEIPLLSLIHKLSGSGFEQKLQISQRKGFSAFVTLPSNVTLK